MSKHGCQRYQINSGHRGSGGPSMAKVIETERVTLLAFTARSWALFTFGIGRDWSDSHGK